VRQATTQDPQRAIEIADESLKADPENRDLLFSKAVALETDQKSDEAENLLLKLANGREPYPAALLQLADSLQYSENSGDRRAAAHLFERYAAIEPDDPRPHSALGRLLDQLKETKRAETEYRTAVSLDGADSEVHVDLAEFLSAQQRYAESLKVIEAAKDKTDERDLLGALYQRLWADDRIKEAEALAALSAGLFAKSATANVYLGRLRVAAGRGREALPLLRRAAELDPKSGDPQVALAECYRSLRNWPAALSAANTALKLDGEDGEAFYQQACALARMGRTREAMAALKRAIEFEPAQGAHLAKEEDLKSLASLPEFKKLMLERKKENK